MTTINYIYNSTVYAGNEMLSIIWNKLQPFISLIQSSQQQRADHHIKSMGYDLDNIKKEL